MGKEKTYFINEIFYSIQGEGIRAGTANVFVRFAHCNLTCSADDEFAGFDCDTEFAGHRKINSDELCAEIIAVSAGPELADIGPHCKNVILTGGEPSMQIDLSLIRALKNFGYYIAIETNGMKELPIGIDWVCVSPKSAEHTIRVKHANELKYVRHAGQAIPKPAIPADNYLISPAFENHQLPKANLEHCIQLVKAYPEWRLSIQLHNFLGVR